MYGKFAAKCTNRLNLALASSIALVFLWCTLIVFVHPYSRAAQYPGSNSKLLHNHWEALTQSTNFTAPTIPALVVAGRDFQRLTWMDDVSTRYTLYPYNVDFPSAKPFQIPINKGNEAMVFLTWIINNYNRLPPYAVFVHGHRTSWHQEAPIASLLNNLRTNALNDVGYISLRCDWYPSCPAEVRPLAHDAVLWAPNGFAQDVERILAEVWEDWFHEPVPETVSSPCCGQFAVTRTAIQRRSKEDYERMRAWLITTPLDDDLSGRIFEKVWAAMFTGEAVHCPIPSHCACTYFGRCEPQKWQQPPPGLQQIPD